MKHMYPLSNKRAHTRLCRNGHATIFCNPPFYRCLVNCQPEPVEGGFDKVYPAAAGLNPTFTS